MSLLVNVVLYQVGWFAIVLGAAHGRPWLGSGVALALVAIHLILAHGRPRQVSLILLAGSIGLGLDSLQLSLGVLRFPSGMVIDWLVPPWDVVLWMQFATILPFGLIWLSRRYVLSSVLGLVGGPLAFYTGERLGAVVFLPPRAMHFLLLGLVWAVAFPTLVWLSDMLVVAPGFGRRYRLLSHNA